MIGLVLARLAEPAECPRCHRPTYVRDTGTHVLICTVCRYREPRR